MKKMLVFGLMALSVWISALAGIEQKLSASTQLFIAERDGKISLDVQLAGPTMPSRAPLLRSHRIERYIASAERINGVDMVPAFIHINPQYASKLETLGVMIQERFKEFVTASIPVNMIERIAEMAEVEQVNVARVIQKKTNMARYYTNDDDVINYSNDAITAGLPQAFKGNGVVIGIIDGGIDFAHTLYNDDNGNTRIKRVYKATSSNRLTEYTSGFSTLTSDDNDESHGTHTSTTAAGRNMTVSNITYGGMAPESDIILVGLGSYMYDTNITNAIKKVFDYADSQGKPAVCSVSLGSHYGPHDGTGELASVCAQYAGTKANHIVVYASSNDANNSFGYVHVEGNSSSSAPMTVLLQGRFYEEYYGYGSSYKNRAYSGRDVFFARTRNQTLGCRLHVVNTSNNSIVWTSNAITSSTSNVSGITTYFTSSPRVTITRHSYSSKYYVEVNTGQIEKTSGYTGSNYALAVSVYPTNGSCMIDGWVNGYNYFGTMSGTIGGYSFVAGSDASCISDEAACEDLISVGAYCSKRSVTDYRGYSHNLSYYTLGDIAYFSSYQAAGSGPTGVHKPDICAPGATIVAGINHNDTYYMNNSYASAGMYLVYNSTTSSLGSMDGTSMSAPCAAGIIALYLQAAKSAGKTLNTEGIRDVFANSAIHDNYTNKVGFGPYGKINALEGVRYILGSTPLDIPWISVNPTSLSFSANVGQTVTKTFTVSGINLVDNITLDVSGSEHYSVTPSTITPEQAAVGVTVIVTYSPTAGGTHEGTVTLTSTGADNKTVALSGSAVVVPIINVNPEALTFNTSVGTPVTQTIYVQGANLTGTIYVSVSGAGFTVDKNSITRSVAAAGTTVTVTYTPTAAGTHTGTVTFSGGGADSKTVTLSGTAVVVPTINVDPETLTFNTTVGTPVTQTINVQGANLTSTIYVSVSGAGFTVNKNSITRSVANAGTTVTVTYTPTATGTHTGTVTFSGGGADTKTVALNGTAAGVPVITASPTTLNMVTTVGTPVTKTFTVTGTDLTGSVSLSVSGTGFTIDKTSITRNQATAGSTVTVTYNPTAFGIHTGTVTLTSNGAETETVVLNGQADLVKFAPVMLPADEQYIGLTQFRADWTDETPAQNVTSYTLEVSPMPIEREISEDLDYRLITGITPDRFYTVENLTAGGTFLYRVKALYLDGTESDWSNIEEVTLLQPGHDFGLGDVNHDRKISIADVTELINYLLSGDETSVCIICANVNQDDKINIADVTALINMLLESPSKSMKSRVPSSLELKTDNRLLAF